MSSVMEQVDESRVWQGYEKVLGKYLCVIYNKGYQNGLAQRTRYYCESLVES